jgi:hypothetical protein
MVSLTEKTKKCPRCSTWFPATKECFGRDARRPDGLRSWCRQCERKDSQFRKLRDRVPESLCSRRDESIQPIIDMRVEFYAECYAKFPKGTVEEFSLEFMKKHALMVGTSRVDCLL